MRTEANHRQLLKQPNFLRSKYTKIIFSLNSVKALFRLEIWPKKLDWGSAILNLFAKPRTVKSQLGSRIFGFEHLFFNLGSHKLPVIKHVTPGSVGDLSLGSYRFPVMLRLKWSTTSVKITFIAQSWLSVAGVHSSSWSKNRLLFRVYTMRSASIYIYQNENWQNFKRWLSSQVFTFLSLKPAFKFLLPENVIKPLSIELPIKVAHGPNLLKLFSILQNVSA